MYDLERERVLQSRPMISKPVSYRQRYQELAKTRKAQLQELRYRREYQALQKEIREEQKERIRQKMELAKQYSGRFAKVTSGVTRQGIRGAKQGYVSLKQRTEVARNVGGTKGKVKAFLTGSLYK
ncbi:MAG: hypothetical protein H7836_10770 [Magnetococcus sp. YQC-3]